MMKITLNGKQEELPDDSTVRGLIVSLGLGEAAVAVELNRDIVPRRNHEATSLKNGDQLELVTLVGGG